jgi:FkbM family methyltransferase
MLKTFRRFRLFNLLIGSFLRFAENSTMRISRRWRVSGEVEIQIDNTTVKMYSKCDDPIVDCFYYGRPYQEASDVSLFIRLAMNSRIIFDVGAFTGLYSLVSARCNSQCKLYSFEPNPVNFQRLIMNRELNKLSNINCFPLAVGSHSTTIDFFCSSNEEITDTSSANFSFSKASYGGRMDWEGQKVQQISIDSFTERECF